MARLVGFVAMAVAAASLAWIGARLLGEVSSALDRAIAERPAVVELGR